MAFTLIHNVLGDKVLIIKVAREFALSSSIRLVGFAILAATASAQQPGQIPAPV
ncbi:MAG: hypothetical protein WBF04_21495 [Candidatus Sulfotelmatobacter sp.]